MPTLSLATKNQHKILELRSLLGPSWDLLPAPANVSWEETGHSFRANALIKAEALRGQLNHAVLADDSGLEVEALNGAPGIYSSRYAGAESTDADNLRKLLRVLQGLPDEMRNARFVCVLCLIDTKGRVHYFEGDCRGRILQEASGKGGFGYDPIFEPEGYNASLAELGEAVKNTISHRARAFAGLRAHLASEQI